MALTRNRAVSPAKLAEVDRLNQLLKKYKVIGLAGINKVPAKALHNLRNTLRKDVVITISKKRIIKRAFDKSGLPHLSELADQIQGITALLFTDMNPIKLLQFLESKAVKGPAKPGDIAPIDILVRAGDTKLAPGPIISELNQHLKLPTMIKDGTIHIRQDTMTHKTGELIQAKQAQLLARLGIEPMVIKLDFYAAWEEGELIPSSILRLNEEEIFAHIRLAAAQAVNLAISLGVLTPETLSGFLIKGIREASAIATSIPVFFPELLDQYFTKATAQAQVLNAAVFGGATAQSSVKPETKSSASSKKEEKKSDEEELGAGISSLFG